MAKDSIADHGEKETFSQKNPKSYRSGSIPKDKGEDEDKDIDRK